MTRSAEALLTEALQLSKEERGEIAERLIESVCSESGELSDEWKAEIDRRIADVEADPASAVPAEQVLNETRKALESRHEGRAG